MHQLNLLHTTQLKYWQAVMLSLMDQRILWLQMALAKG